MGDRAGHMLRCVGVQAPPSTSRTALCTSASVACVGKGSLLRVFVCDLGRLARSSRSLDPCVASLGGVQVDGVPFHPPCGGGQGCGDPVLPLSCGFGCANVTTPRFGEGGGMRVGPGTRASPWLPSGGHRGRWKFGSGTVTGPSCVSSNRESEEGHSGRISPYWCGLRKAHPHLVTTPSGCWDPLGGSRRRPLPRLRPALPLSIL